MSKWRGGYDFDCYGFDFTGESFQADPEPEPKPSRRQRRVILIPALGVFGVAVWMGLWTGGVL